MKRFQKIVAMALAATLAVPGTMLSTFASAQEAESKGFFTSFENGDAWADSFKANTLEVVDGKGKTENVVSTTADRLVGDVTNTVVLSSIKGSENQNNNEIKEKLFDNNASTKYLAKQSASKSNPVWVSFQLAAPKAIRAYSMVSANDAEARDPVDWTFSGSDDGENWTVLDTQTGIKFSSRFQSKTFIFENDTAYAYYKINITKNNGDSGMVQFADLNVATLDQADDETNKVAMATTIESGPASVHDADSNKGWTGSKALKVSGYHQGEGEAYAYNVIYDGLDIPVTENTQLSYVIFPEWTTGNYDFEYTSTYISVDLGFSDGTYLSDLNAVDQNGNIVSPMEQGLSKTLTTKQWNKISTYVASGEDTVGKTITKVLVGYHKPSNPTGSEDAFAANIDDIRIEEVPQVAHEHLSDYVYTLRGTNDGTHYSRGLVCPGTTMPHGFNFWAPVTRAGDNKMYNYQLSRDGNTLKHLTISHQASFWTGERGTYEFMANSSFDPATVSSIGTGVRGAKFTHENEIAKAHHYSVTFDANDTKAGGVTMEVTPTEHAAVLRFTFPESAPYCNVLFDCDRASGATQFSEDGMSFTGYSNHTSNGMQRMYVYGEFSQPAATSKTIGKGGIANFEKAASGETIVEMKVATSFISYEQAKKNLQQEIAANEGFDEIFAKAQKTWDDQLGIIEIEGATPDQMTSFYSGMYRLFMYPNLLSEKTGEGSDDGWQYKSPYGSHDVKDGVMYYNNGFWDTYRTTWGAYSLLTPSKDIEMLNGLVEHYNDQGWVPRWIAPGGTNSMVGTSSDVIFGDAAKKGLDFEVENAFKSALKNASVVSNNLTNGGRTDLARSVFNGYTSLDVGEGFSWSMEGYVNDFGIYQMAKALGYADEEQYYLNRAQNYVNLFNDDIGWFMGRNINGAFRTSSSDFDPGKWWGDYTETNAFNMAFSVPQDGQGLANLYGGREALAERLDGLFNAAPELVEDGSIHEMVEARDLKMGLYGHSNQPSHHIPYMYNYAGRPDRTQEVVREVLARAYVGSDLGQGYIGDEDNGEMSAWYVLSALGMYPVNMGSGEYAIGSPLFKKATVHLECGEDLVINAPNNSKENIYVQGVKLNGEDYNKLYFNYSDLINGAVIDFDMDNTPSDWGTSEDALPTSITTGDKAAEPSQDMTSKTPVIASEAPSGSVMQDMAYSAETSNVANLFDNTSTTTAALNGGTASVYYSFVSPVYVDMVTLTTTSDPAKAPTGFTLYGSEDGVNWISLHSRTDLTFNWAKYTRPFAVNAGEKYAHYRIDFTGSGDSIELAEIELLGNAKKSLDRAALQKLVAAAEEKDLSVYPASKAEAFQAALEAAKAVLEKGEEATQEEIRDAVDALQKASNNLGTVRNPYVRLEAETFDGGNVVKDTDSNRSGGGNIGGGKNGFHAMYNNVNFGEKGAVHVVMSYSSQASDASNDGRIQLFLDSMDGEPVAELKTHNTAQSGWSTYVLSETDIDPAITGSHDLYIKLIGTEGKAYVANIDYFDFTEGQGGVSGTYDLTVEYSGRNASLAVDGQAQGIADKINVYKGEADTGSTVELTFIPAIEGRSFAGVTLNGEALELTSPDSFTYKYQMGTEDAVLKFDFTVVSKTVLQTVINAADALVGGEELDKVLPSIKKQFEDALAAAKKINEKLDATQKQIDDAWGDLLDVIHLLSFELGDTTELEALLETAYSFEEEYYTTDSWNALQEAIKAAEQVLADDEPLKNDVDKAASDLHDAIYGMEKVADFSQLQMLIEKAEEIDLILEEKYVPDEKAFDAFHTALDNAKELTKDSAQKDIDEAALALNIAMADLRKKADKSELKDLLEELKALDPADYTAESYAAVAAAIESMEVVLADESLDDEDGQVIVDATVKNALTAQSGLKENDNKPVPTPDKPSKGGSGSKTSVPGNSYGSTGIVAAGQSVAASGAYIVSDTTVNFTLKRGSAYCFKMTVVNGKGEVPSFTVGNGGVLKTQFVAKIGNDCYYRIYAIGTPGQSTGVYTMLPGQNVVKHCTVTIG